MVGNDAWSDLPNSWFAAARSVDGRRPGGPHWQGLVEAMRRVQDSVAGSDPDDDAVLAATARLHEIADVLEPFGVPEERQAYGRRLDLPGTGQHLRPHVTLTHSSRDRLEGAVAFTRVYLGAGHAVHGGVIGLVFDNFLGALAHAGGRPLCRTAYIHVDYRALTPLDTPLVVAAWYRKEEGRKRVLAGELRHGDVVCAEAEGLFVELRRAPTE